MYQKGRAWIELDMKNLASNLRQLQSLLPEDCLLMPAVKANAYGHEAVLIGKCGNMQITADEFADMAGTISNEILSRLGSRLERISVP